jgi:class 3 adenylate cyclase/pimeloyl-ACP methyl ester carboxylesterase
VGKHNLMAKARVERRLAAVLAADVAAYSRMMGVDEEGTLAALKAYRHELIDPKIAEHHGRIVKNTGDGVLVEFASAVDAVQCAIEIQRAIAERNANLPESRRIEMRIGINVGDIIVDDGDIYGDSINVAARLENIADRGGISISRQVLDQIDGKLDIGYRELGRQNLKNIPRPVEIYAIDVGAAGPPGSRFLATANLQQEIRYCRAPDGVRLAYATVGRGPALVKSAHWLGHLEYDWEFPISRSFLLGLAKGRMLVRYDARGNGLSDWDVGGISLDSWVSDMETVVDAAHLGKFPLFGLSQGCAVSIAFAARHPDRVSHLILYGGFAVGFNKRPNLTEADKERFAAMKTLIKLGWGSDDPTFRQIFTSSMLPDATRVQSDAFNELQRLSGSSEGALRYLEAVAELDVRELLPQITAPTLVMHVRDDRRVPIELGREIAAGIPDARFVVLPGKNHILLEQDPGLPRFFEEIQTFLEKTI